MTMTAAHADLIDRLGGGTRVAEALTKATGERCDREAVYKWKRNGVPWKWRVHVCHLAEAMGETVPDDFVDTRIRAQQLFAAAGEKAS
ncbi:hypothetical protein DRB17_17880 [Ferruginivarius sediminum]|uniref:XRE family transcriptional regulator n=1 Tax=Ferruginivarius sediminum TaxID=2661937 RepID=A0A369T567_9PROT|nr:hypothetical protein DRB17_17880 [Ferruginivarius sediminum]